ncbi:MAG: peptidoglycan-associated lipoprotein Pal [Pseudomonadota bacterium]|jgi:peptidoglycan-associated lipoprotein|uniref:Peptidoglycan-associated protein n=1 Tax=Pseudaquabacterium rugosum TaxID=2984194 RepID=A0ABU9B9C1_9BURK
MEILPVLNLKSCSVLAVAALLAACSTPPAPTPAASASSLNPAAGAKGASSLSAPAAAAGAGAGAGSASDLSASRAAAAQAVAKPTANAVHFDFDQFVVKSEFVQVLDGYGAWMLKNADAKLRVEGNADERGGREYNLALGQKRADAVVRALTSQGVAAGRLEAVSWGKDKPRATGHDEAAWAENRRADLVSSAK